MRTIFIILCTVLSPLLVVHGAEPIKKPPPVVVPPPPPISQRPSRTATPPAEPETGLEPEITIVTRDDATFQEYRSHGKLYMVKVTPKQGKPYYLIDREGEGKFRRSDIEPTISVPTWVIKSW